MATTFRKDTGDLAKSDRDDFLTITGRLKELIIRGGQNIAPAEIEEVVNTFESVVDCAVVGIPPHASWRGAGAVRGPPDWGCADRERDHPRTLPDSPVVLQGA
jgi:acyl-CoA synthetase (AMP-forming)/AMP-acid ligase II